MKINFSKSEYGGRREGTNILEVDGEKIENVKALRYLVSILDETGECSAGVQAR